ncbi:head GIN domain-containing protein [Aurantiacibacter poecillastricola]|uniref:head GIN domain-containing protein n=1 Tax=Aurantiacibacter poecillastricola TaxID=3064385 RepID=UPI00273EC760|nr:head GIN domain-containing protein [Aurantiacibacter sp. 219JJ12-13]MDP5260793.1 head GIN domain-containing protein [Aurantiacibacter sp. 219JJ12-13]
MNTIRTVLVAGSAILAIAGCSQSNAQGDNYAASQYANGARQIEGSGNVVRREVAIGNFDRLELGGPMDVEIRQSATPGLVIMAEDNLIDLVEVEVEEQGGTLVLSTRGSFRTRIGLRAVATVPDLESVSITGSGDIDLAGWEADRLDLGIEGSGDIRLNGRVDTVRAKIDGSGDIDLRSADIREARASVNGSGDIRLGSLDRLTARINGSGDIDARDVRVVDQAVYGTGDIRIASAR